MHCTHRLQVGIGLLFWPLALSLRLANALLAISFGGARGSRRRRLRSPPRWLVQFMSLPLRVLNPPVVLGSRHLRALADTLATAAAASAGAADGATAAVAQQEATAPLLPSHGGAEAGRVRSGTDAAGAADAESADGAAAARSHKQAPVLLVGNHTFHGLDHLPLLHVVRSSTGTCPHTLYEQGLDGIPLWTLFAGIVCGA
jgi:hypothetical protein